MMRFVNKNKGVIDYEKRIFKRGDGTLATFFNEEKLTEMMEKAGLKKVTSEYCTVEIVNHKRDLKMRRAFLNAIYQA